MGGLTTAHVLDGYNDAALTKPIEEKSQRTNLVGNKRTEKSNKLEKRTISSFTIFVCACFWKIFFCREDN